MKNNKRSIPSHKANSSVVIVNVFSINFLSGKLRLIAWQVSQKKTGSGLRYLGGLTMKTSLRCKSFGAIDVDRIFEIHHLPFSVLLYWFMSPNLTSLY